MEFNVHTHTYTPQIETSIVYFNLGTRALPGFPRPHQCLHLCILQFLVWSRIPCSNPLLVLPKVLPITGPIASIYSLNIQLACKEGVSSSLGGGGKLGSVESWESGEERDEREEKIDQSVTCYAADKSERGRRFHISYLVQEHESPWCAWQKPSSWTSKDRLSPPVGRGGGALKEEKGIKTTNMVRLVQIVMLGSVAWYLTGGEIENYRVHIFSIIIALLWGGYSSAVDIVGSKSRWKWILEGNGVRCRKHPYQPVFSKQAPAPALYYLITFKQTPIVEENKTDVTEKPDYFNILYHFSYLLRS